MLLSRLIVIAGALAATPVALAQTVQAVPRIGVLSPFKSAGDGFRDAFLQRLNELGYVAGRNIHLEYRSAEGLADALPRLAVDLVKQKVNVLVTTTAPGTQAAKQATATIPIIMAGVDDAVEQGFVSSLANPGGNITGVSWLNTALSAKRVELVKHALPGITRLAYLREAVGAATSLQATEAAARSLGLQLLIIEIRGPDEIDGAVSALVHASVGALIVAQGPVRTGHEPQLIALARKHRLPTIFAYRKAVDAGALMSYGPDLRQVYRGAASYADRILRSSRPDRLPVEQPTRFELVINLKTAGVLGVAIPTSVLVGADEVIR